MGSSLTPWQTLPDGEVIHLEDMGSEWYVAGIVIGNKDKTLTMYLPDEVRDRKNFVTYDLGHTEWWGWLQAADDAKIVVKDKDDYRLVKAVVRKSQRALKQDIVWEVYRRDDFTCQYCGHRDRPMTVDHVIPQALGGEDSEENLVTCCRPCNKLKANRTPEEWRTLAISKGLRGKWLTSP